MGRRTKRYVIGFLWVILLLFFVGKGLDIVSALDGSNLKYSNFKGNGEEWNLILVNQWNHVPEGYEVDFTLLSNGERVDSRIYPALQQMFDDMRTEGIYPVVGTGYRSREEQENLMNERIEAYEAEGYSHSEAENLAEEWVAVPGTSEHELGIAVDINADKSRSTSNEVYEWLAENASRYGFILRYPADKTEITGTAYEPWHYRYVGQEAAKEIKSRGICLEEYLYSK